MTKELQPLTIEEFVGREYDNVRCRYFYGTDKWRKAINEACKIADSDIGVVYILGEGIYQPVKNYAEKKKKDNLIVLYLDGMGEWLENLAWWNKQYSIGCKVYGTINKGKVNEKWVDELKKMVAHHKQLLDSGEAAEWTRKNYEQEIEHLRWLDEGDSELRRLWQEKVKGGWQVICSKRVQTVKDFVLATYPYGVEAVTENEKAYKNAPKLIREIPQSVLEGKVEIGKEFGVSYTGSGFGQLSLFGDNIAVTECVDFVNGYINSRFDKDGYFELTDLILEMQKPPYGYYLNSYYAFVVCVGMYEALKGQTIYYTDGIYSEKLKRLGDISKNLGMVFNIFVSNTHRRRKYILYKTDKSRQMLNELVADIFGIKCYDTLNTTLLYARRWCEEHLTFPISVYNTDLYEILDTNNFYDNKVGKYYNRLYELKGTIKADLPRIDEICIERYAERAGQRKAVGYYKYIKGCSNTARTWAYNVSFEFEHFDKYASGQMQREAHELAKRLNDGNIMFLAERERTRTRLRLARARG